MTPFEDMTDDELRAAYRANRIMWAGRSGDRPEGADGAFINIQRIEVVAHDRRLRLGRRYIKEER